MRIDKVSDLETRYLLQGQGNQRHCGGEHLFAAQVSLQIDAEIAENSRFRTETS
jgi:hypothetical protein